MEEDDGFRLDDPAAWAEALKRSRWSRVTVVCSDKGQHGQLDLQAFDVTEDGDIIEVTARDQAFRGGTTDDGATVANRAVVPVISDREVFEGHVKYRFLCSVCGRDTALAEGRLRAALVVLATTKRKTLDISLL